MLVLFFRCETCGKGFLRRERFVTHVRIHTGEKPFVCAVCNRGYRDKRELKKHQISHNHSGQSAPIPGNAAAATTSGTIVNPASGNATVIHQTTMPSALGSPTLAHQPQQQHLQQQQQIPQQVVQATSPDSKTIIVQQTIQLPSHPVPKAQLNGGAQVVQPPQPLNPATIPLPPSVATALQSINEKVAAKQAKEAAIAKMAQAQPLAQVQQQQPQTITITKQEPQQVQQTQQMFALPANAQLAAAPANGSNGSGPLFYYVMPGSVPYSLSSEGGTTVRLTTTEGNVTTAQLVSVPSGGVGTVQQVNGTPNGGATILAAAPGTQLGNVQQVHQVNAGQLTQWVQEGGSVTMGRGVQM